MKPNHLLTLVLCVGICQTAITQEFDKSSTISIFSGSMNYQGDVKPDNFTNDHSNFAAGITYRKPLNRWVTFRMGAHVGTITGNDQWNTEDLKPRNLNFTSTIKEAHLGFEVTLL